MVSPYLGTHGLYSEDGAESHCCVLGETVNLKKKSKNCHVSGKRHKVNPPFLLLCLSEKRSPWGWSKSTDQPSKNPVVRSKSYNIPLLLTPVAEYDPDASSVGSGGIRRHSACEIITCLEEQGLAYADLASGSELSGPSSNRLCVGSQFNGMSQIKMSEKLKSYCKNAQ